MSCFRILYQNYLAVLNGKNWVVDLVLKDAFVLIKVVAGRKEIDPYKQLSVLIDLLDKYDIENYGFNVLTLLFGLKLFPLETVTIPLICLSLPDYSLSDFFCKKR